MRFYVQKLQSYWFARTGFMVICSTLFQKSFTKCVPLRFSATFRNIFYFLEIGSARTSPICLVVLTTPCYNEKNIYTMFCPQARLFPFNRKFQQFCLGSFVFFWLDQQPVIIVALVASQITSLSDYSVFPVRKQRNVDILSRPPLVGAAEPWTGVSRPD